MVQYSQQQWLVLVPLCMVNMCNYLCISQYAPFFIKEARHRGASPLQYGAVLGIYHLMKFFGSILCGKYFHHTGPKLLLILGALCSSGTFILVGFLNHVMCTGMFIDLALVIKSVEGISDAALRTMSFTIIANEFPEHIGSVFGILYLSCGLGSIIGPFVGGLLHQLGGFTLPFVGMGCILLLCTIISAMLLPDDGQQLEVLNSNQNILLFLNTSSIPLFIYVITSAGYGIGFLAVFLEPHLSQFHLSSTALGAVFLLVGATNDIASPIWGRLCDKVLSPTIVTIIGGSLISTAFLVLGPAPYIPLDNTLIGCCIALLILSIGISGELVGSFCGMLQGAAKAGLPINVMTRGLVSSFYVSSASIGMFLGAVSGGLLMKTLGLKWTSVVIIGLHLLVVAGGGILICRYSQHRNLPVIDTQNTSRGEELINNSELATSYGSNHEQDRIMSVNHSKN